MTLVSTESGHKFIKPKKPELKPSKEIEIFEEPRRRIIEAFRKVSLSYDPPDYSTKHQIAQEKISCHLQAEHPEYIEKHLLGITRVKLPIPHLFENDKGEFDDTIKSALVYRVNVSIKREDAAKAGIHDDFIHSCLFTMGRYPNPIAKYTFNEKHEIINTRVVGSTRRYYIPDTKKNIEDIFKRFGQPWKLHSYTVAIASHSGSMHYHNDMIFTVYDYDDFVNTDIDLLIAANQSGFLEDGKKGRVELYEQFAKKQEARRRQGENITPKKFLKEIDSE